MVVLFKKYFNKKIGHYIFNQSWPKTYIVYQHVLYFTQIKVEAIRYELYYEYG